ncbi:hypothetical protein, partial [Kaarinaea lacus]
MYSKLRQFQQLIAISLLAIIAGCGGNGDSTTPTQTTITGTVTAPAPSVVLFEQQNLMDRFASLLIPDLHAEVTGLTPVVSAMVELIRINDDGSQKGAVIETAMTDDVTGQYSLTFTGTLSDDLVVQVTATSGVSMRALVRSEVTDINPVTEYLLQVILAIIQVDNENLSAVSEESLALAIASIEALDISFTDTMTINETTQAIADAVSTGGVNLGGIINSNPSPEVGSSNGIPCSTTGSPYSYYDFEPVVYNCGASSIAQFEDRIVPDTILDIDGLSITLLNQGFGYFGDFTIDQVPNLQWGFSSQGYLFMYEFEPGAQDPVRSYSVVIIGTDTATGKLKVKIYTEDTNSSPVPGDHIFNAIKDGAISDGLLTITPPASENPPPADTGIGTGIDVGLYAGSWISPCISKDSTTWTTLYLIVQNDKTFTFALVDYSDASCTNQTTYTEVGGTLVIGTDRVLDDGSTGNPVEMTITSP